MEGSLLKRRLSPRLHCNDDSHSENHSTRSTHSTHSIEGSSRRCSPRLHKHSTTSTALSLSPLRPSETGESSPPKHEVDATTATATATAPQIKHRFSPRLQLPPKTEGQDTASGGATYEKRLYDDLPIKRSKHRHHENDGCETNNSHSNGEQLRADRDVDDGVNVAGKSIHSRVKETLRLYNTYYLQFLKEKEDKLCEKIENDKKNKASKSKDKEKKRCEKSKMKNETKNKASKSTKNGVDKSSSRPDLRAISKMIEEDKILYPEKKIGHVPGIEVGYQFYSRCEMVAIGFHRHWMSGIDFIGDKKKRVQQHHTLPIATSIVMSGQYEDDQDNSEDVIFTGQGGNDLLGSKKQCADQTMSGGNLALKNNMKQSIPVRVTRGHEGASKSAGKIYTYDGLYKVVDHWAEKGQSGHLVYKYRLRRLEGQPTLTTQQVQFVRECSSKAAHELPALICPDFSNGEEDNCIPVTNSFDDAPIVAEGFTYIKTLQVAENVDVPVNAPGCACKGKCTNPKVCACAKLNGSDFPYVCNDGGRLVEAKDIVFECGPNCGCGPGCLNRTSQRGIKYRLEIYRTPDKGWAVRSRDFIPSGAPVCEYIGLLRRSDEVDSISENDYIFEIDCLHTMNEVEGRERRLGNLPVSTTSVLPKIDDKTLDGTPEFCIDAESSGNVARFINHSCEPNLFVQCILSSHHDLRLARVVLFAADNIPPMQELTYDYGYALDSVIGPNGEVKELPCFCGTSDCRGRLY